MRVTLSLVALSAVVAALPAPHAKAVTPRGNTDDVSVDATYTENNWKKVVRDANDVDATYTSINWKKVSRDNADVDATYTANNWRKTAKD